MNTYEPRQPCSIWWPATDWPATIFEQCHCAYYRGNYIEWPNVNRYCNHWPGQKRCGVCGMGDA